MSPIALVPHTIPRSRRLFTLDQQHNEREQELPDAFRLREEHVMRELFLLRSIAAFGDFLLQDAVPTSMGTEGNDRLLLSVTQD